MIMKQYICLAIVALACNYTMAQPDLSSHTWTMTIKVVDEQGNPIPAAKTGVGFYTNSQPASIDGVTDKNGVFIASQTVGPSLSGYWLGFSAEKDGYYTTRSGLNLDFNYDPVKWSPTKTLVLRNIGKPIAMYAKSVNLGMPAFDKAVGFDLMIGDWVGPYGTGVSTDIIFTGHLDQRAESDSSYKLTVSFPKVGDGIQEFVTPDAEMGSDLHSPHEAPVNGYQSQWVQIRNRKPGQPETGNLDLNRNYIFRVRTALDHQGNVVSAHYGKIYGDFMKFRFYLNPTSNSRNIEFDQKQNLLGGLQSFEQVREP
jgi:hypothetical protein